MFAVVFGRGIASVEKASWADALAWLSSNGYATSLLDFSSGISPVIQQLGRELNWVENFGYELLGDSRNLAALHDGFHFEVPASGGLALLLCDFRKAMAADLNWSKGFLSILSEHSLRQLACGNRFFGLLEVQDSESPVVGQVFESLSVPYPFPLRGTAAA